MRWLALAILWATPAAAFPPMTMDDCRAGWQRMKEIVDIGVVSPAFDGFGEGTEVERLSVALTEDGWCRMTRSGGDRREVFDWQAEGMDRLVEHDNPPLALRLRAKAADGPREGPSGVDSQISLRQVPGTGTLLVNDLKLSTPDGVPVLSLAGVVNGAYFDTKSSFLTSIGGLTLSQLTGVVHISPEAQAVWGEQAFYEAFADLVDGLSRDQIDAADHDDLKAAFMGLPDSRGEIRFSALSERGLGWLQIVMAQTYNPDATRFEMIAFALSGVRVSASWHPE